ncbi:LysR family transcriptional regulator [Corynebacterium flavescens]|uniref:LysR family transcriptional regulator n=1 Tax=Corynebacterium flavescens TaxID=28028 RepID=UPI003FD1852F
MDRQLLGTFRTVVEVGSLSSGAKVLHLTQPAVSKQLKKLETSLGLKHLKRTPTGIALSAAGEMLYELSGDILPRMSRAESLLRSRFASETTLRVAGPQTTASVLIAPFIAEENPPISDVLMVPASEIDELLDRDIDMGVSTVQPPPHRSYQKVASLPLKVQAPPLFLQ